MENNGGDPRKNRKKIIPVSRYYLILLAILMLLIFILFLIPEKEGEQITVDAQENPRITSNNQVLQRVVPERPVPEKKYPLYIVIDDVGYNLSQLDSFLSFPGKITFAVLPGLPHTQESARRIHAAGKTVILHQPMEPLGQEDPGPGAIYSGMDKDTVYEILSRNLEEVPYAIGMNNHMGSKVTSDERMMEIILSFCRERDLLFLDSRTTPDAPVSEAIAKTINTNYIFRNSDFLDNEKNKESILKAFSLGLGIAQKRGKAVMIGHVTSAELAESLMEMYPSLIEDGYTFEELTDFIFRKEPYDNTGY